MVRFVRVTHVLVPLGTRRLEDTLVGAHEEFRCHRWVWLRGNGAKWPYALSTFSGADDAATFEEAEIPAASGSKEVRESRSQLVALTDLVTQQAAAARQLVDTARRQEVRMQRLEDLLLQQAAAGRLSLREKALTAPPAQVSVTAATFPLMVERAERQRLMDRLDEFRKRDPRILDGEKTDPWIIEKWLMHMEKLSATPSWRKEIEFGSPLTIWTARL
uniref:Uncharacterized protein n=1 Tax=Ananas comosus var. bracteatus TaxID=296719 RepID=A0A6V7P557_ANACO|nr:unnamed protein product [Ananas comosus var. bracteatus]